jgi:glutathione S-transferase
MTDQLILGYWAIRGLAQSIRLALHYTKTPFINKIYEQGGPPDYSREKWLSEKETLGLDFPNLPYLIDNDIKITQSKAILYYLGQKYNLMGTTPEEEAQAIMLCEESYDLHIQFAIFCYGPNVGSETERKKFVETTLSDYLKKFDDYLGKNNTKFAVGNQPTIADFQVYDCLDICFLLDDDGNVLPKKFVNIKRYLEEFRQLPELKNFIEKSEKELPLNSPSK